MKRLVGNRRKKKSGTENSSLFAKSTSLLSVNGKLRSPYYEPGEQEVRNQAYIPVEIGKPLVVRYLYFFLKLDNANSKHQEIMVSTFVKTEEEKKSSS
ncbi:hypothetical protein [Saccharicrinis sp. 156]|uniref:hypothetical protein n=1 Tax=Saccharicrinis sp. 156 TaxID=3417574 RepID=UPI003D340757